MLNGPSILDKKILKWLWKYIKEIFLFSLNDYNHHRINAISFVLYSLLIMNNFPLAEHSQSVISFARLRFKEKILWIMRRYRDRYVRHRAAPSAHSPSIEFFIFYTTRVSERFIDLEGLPQTPFIRFKLSCQKTILYSYYYFSLRFYRHLLCLSLPLCLSHFNFIINFPSLFFIKFLS